MADLITCTITCTRLGCDSEQSWEDQAPQRRGPLAFDANRTPPHGWVLAGENPYGGQLLERAKGICAKCQKFECDTPSGRVKVTATAPGVFEVHRPDGAYCGQLRGACRRWFLAAAGDFTTEDLGAVGHHINALFDEQTFTFEGLTFTYRMPSPTAAIGAYPDGPGSGTAFSMCLGEHNGRPHATISCCVPEGGREARGLLALAYQLWPQTLPRNTARSAPSPDRP